MSSNPYNTPGASGHQAVQAAGTRSVVVKRVDVLSCGIMVAAFYAILGLFGGGIFFLFSMLGVAVGGGGADAVMGGLIGSAVFLIIGPLFYGAFGFIFGILSAAFYNLVAGIAGGIRIDLAS